MGTTKTDIHSIDTIEVAQVAKVLAHPARVAILKYISEQEGCICNDITEEVGLSQATVSQHLQVIRDAGLIQGNVKGKSVCYCLSKSNFDQFSVVMDQFFKGLLK
ncbi:ArsR/SmtB family transcription factor [Spongiivirga citrea]|uniref:Metalloregulator ArsR/SmtB family transcription factor n=1 Tax=Spongiivirga citrea TaxID=1481457 RepID=A0A6M0CJN3_9FLAO|nr:metalloregulator ArsR/SmtB family transcription factor [Spongiivirga citrea]NER18051.1 metalloregulator ArsR/SmtB family transcription factor [Spongiivirga citrea]